MGLRPFLALRGSISPNTRMNVPCAACAHCPLFSPTRAPDRLRSVCITPKPGLCSQVELLVPHCGSKGQAHAGLAHVHAVGTGASCAPHAHLSSPKETARTLPLFRGEGCRPHVTAGYPPGSPSRPGPASILQEAGNLLYKPTTHRGLWSSHRGGCTNPIST